MKKQEETPKHLYDIFIDKRVKIYLNDQNVTEILGILKTERHFEILILSKVKDKEGNLKDKMRLILKQSILYIKEV